jgi:undecaprenyl-diphosphatase
MSNFEALILGIIQGLTEFLPISSDGHLEIANYLLGTHNGNNLSFTIVVHGATVLSILVVFASEIQRLIKGLFRFEWNEETQYTAKLVVSMVPVLIVGLFFKDWVESFFTSNMLVVGSFLLVTALFLLFGHIFKNGSREISYLDAFVMGIAQATAVMPGLSRSATTISTGLMLGNKKEDLARFSFLMVIVPILGANALDILKGNFLQASVGITPLVVGFITAFLVGLLACKWMINVVKKGKLIYFSLYCLIVGLIAILTHIL